MVYLNTYSISQATSPGTSKGLDGEDLSFFHLSPAGVLHERDLLIAMDLVALDIMSAEVTYGFDWVGFPFQLNLVALHNFLDRGTYLAHACVDTGFLQYTVSIETRARR